MSKRAQSPIRIAITTGDQDGIGPEVTYRALAEIGNRRGIVFYVFRGATVNASLISRAQRAFRKLNSVTLLRSSPQALRDVTELTSHLQSGCVEIISHESPALWVKAIAEAMQTGVFDAIATAPLSKTEIKKAGISAIGHTEILQRASKAKTAFMGFVGENFSVVLGSGHVSLSKAPKSFLTSLDKSIQASLQLRQILPPSKRKLPVAIIGIDPHCGESGLIGNQDGLLANRISKLAKSGVPIVGPLVPDTAFQKSNWKRYSVFLASNHDQGLIPFKLIHGFNSGVHLTLGISILRTSVDHGTAKDLFGKNKAQYGSMKDAILTACELSSVQRKGKSHV